jgi:segregation and condensation protein A
MPQIRIPAFEGPLHLLLQLIERDDLDVTTVSLVAVTDQYLAAIRKKTGIDVNALAEFVAIGAKLIYLKSKALLPPDPGESEFDDDDVGRELVDLLLEYRRYREVAEVLHERQQQGFRFFVRTAPPPQLVPGPGLDGVTMEMLRALMEEALARVLEEKPPRAFIRRETLTLAQRIEDLRERLRKRGKFSFRNVMAQCETRIEIVIVFMAILELLKAGECAVVQEQRFGDIAVTAGTVGVGADA